jgi:2-polyprenyl-3-methyl-5-hydroxy-6-metoxy-1,4-benzoquinol methylase
MKSISTLEREKYSTVWQSIDHYGALSPGEQYLPIFLHMVGDRRGAVLDAGCGSGKGALALEAAGFEVALCDLTDDGVVPEAKHLRFFDTSLWADLSWIGKQWSRKETTLQRLRRDSARAFDFAYCCDVLEHIPPQFTMLVIDQLLRTAPTVFVALCNIHDVNGAWVGQALHQTVQPFTWWRDSFREVATVLDARDLHDNSAFLLERK